MAAITAVGTALASTLNQSSYACASFTPTAGRLLFVLVMVSDVNPAAPTLTDTSNNNGLTFTQVTRAHKINTSNSTQVGEAYLFVADQATPASPAAMTLTISGVTGATGCIMMMGEVDGLSRVGTSAIRQSQIVSDVQGGTAPATVFSAAALTGNPTAFGVQASVGTGVTQPTGWTERADVTYATPTTGGEWASRDSGFTGQTITCGSSSNGPCCAIAVEFDTSAVPVPANVVCSPAAAVAGVPAPVVSGGAQLTSTPARAVASVPSPAPSAAAQLVAAPAAAIAQTPAPGVSAAALVQAGPARALAAAPPPPQLSAGAVVPAAPAAAVAGVPSPAPIAGASVAVGPASAVAAVPPATVAAGANILARPAAAIAALPTHTPTAGALIQAAASWAIAALPRITGRIGAPWKFLRFNEAQQAVTFTEHADAVAFAEEQQTVTFTEET